MVFDELPVRDETRVHVPVHALFRLVSSCLECGISSFSANHDFGAVTYPLLDERTTTALLGTR